MSTVLHNPIAMRPRKAYFWDGKIGEYDLTDGRRVSVIWVPTTQTHTHIYIYDQKTTLSMAHNVARFNAGHRSEQMLRELEGSI